MRVRVLDLTEKTVTPGISGLLEQIRPFLTHGLLLPSLRSSVFIDTTVNQTQLLRPHLRLFLPSGVTKMWMAVRDISECSLLPILLPIHSSFTPVTLATDRWTDTNLISTFLRSLDRVTDLDVPTFNRAALEHLGSLATLKSLIKDHPNELACELYPGVIPPTSTGFPALIHLSFYNTPPDFIAALIQGLSNSPVARLFLRNDFPPKLP
jgi:hypothetical protein